MDLSPGVVGQVSKTLIDRVLKQEEGPHKTSIGRSVTPLLFRRELSIRVEGVSQLEEGTEGCLLGFLTTPVGVETE